VRCFKTFAASLFVLSGSTLKAEVGLRKWAVNANYAGAGVRYQWGPTYSTELRGQAADHVSIVGFRNSIRLAPARSLPGLIPYLGLETDYARFRRDSTSGGGYAIEGYVGGEYFISSHWSCLLDFGPAWIHLADDQSSLLEQGLEFVINLGINFHFGSLVRR
jgi:hypothetical protein